MAPPGPQIKVQTYTGVRPYATLHLNFLIPAPAHARSPDHVQTHIYTIVDIHPKVRLIELAGLIEN